MKPKTDTNPMDDAYKSLDGSPSATGVSDAAKGNQPANDNEQFRDDTNEHNDRLYGGGDAKCMDINQAYAMLFESLAVIMKNS